ncbi:MAG: PAS domain S-box protein, partial [Bacteroidota bacterium]
MTDKELEIQILQNRINVLEQRLAEAQAANHHGNPLNLYAASDDVLRQALWIAPYPLMIWREDGKVLMINATFTEITGYTRQDVPDVQQWVQKAMAGQPFPAPTINEVDSSQRDTKKWREMEITILSGEKRIWDFSNALLGRDETGQRLMMTMAVDLSERRQIEEQMEENEQKFSIIFEKAPFAASLSRLPEGILVNINEEFERTFGFTKQEAIGYTSLDLNINPDVQTRAQIISQLQSQGSARNIETRLYTKSGEEGLFLLNLDLMNIGGQQYVLQTAQDITERKQAEKARQDSEERFSKAFHKSPFGMNITRWKDGAILDANDAWLNLLGWTREDVIGRNTSEFRFYARPEERSIVRDRIMSEEIPGDMELHVLRKDGSELIVNVGTTLIELQGERCILGALNDITERKKAEDALKESEQRYRGLFERMQEGLIAAEVITDEKGRPVDYRYLDVNPATERQFGISREKFIGHTYTEVLPDQDQQWIEFLGNVALTGEPASLERYGLAASKWFEAHAYSPRPGQFVNILTDITERKKAEQALRQSEERFAKAFHSSPDAIVISRISDGMIIDVNEGWIELLGHQPGEVIGHTAVDLDIYVNADDRKKAIERIREDGSIRNYELEIRRKSHEVRLVSLSAEIIEVNGEDALLTVVRDITEHKKVEEALKASEAKMRAVFRALTEGVVFLNRDGEVEEANDAVLLTYEHTIRELADPKLDPRFRIIRPDGTPFPVEEQPAMVALRTGETVRDVEMGVPTKSGRLSWRLVNAQPVLDDQGALLGVVASFFDITERRQAEQALRESEERFRSLADSMPQLVWTALPDGRVDYYNQRHLEYQDIQLRQGNDWEWAPVLHPEDTQPTVDAWLRSVETGEIYQIEHRVRMRGGSYRWHLSRGVPMHDENGQVIRWFGTATDIHDLKLAEEQLKFYANRLEKSNRELEQFAFMASHDLQEPLRKIEMFGDLLMDRAVSLQA